MRLCGYGSTRLLPFSRIRAIDRSSHASGLRDHPRLPRPSRQGRQPEPLDGAGPAATAHRCWTAPGARTRRGARRATVLATALEPIRALLTDARAPRAGAG